MKQKSKGKTLGYYNLAKGFGMALVVLSHSVSDTIIIMQITNDTILLNALRVLGAGTMAMFFMITGFGMFYRKPKKVWHTNMKLMIVPYYVTALLIVLTRSALGLVTGRSVLTHGLDYAPTYLLALNSTTQILSNGIPLYSVSIFWFLWALFGGSLLYNRILKIKDEKKQYILSFLCVLLGYLMTLLSKTWPFAIPMAFLAVGYMAAGHWIYKNNLINKKVPVWCWIIMLVLIIVSCVYGYIDIAYCQYGIFPVDMAASYCVGFIILKIFSWIKNRNWDNVPVRFLEFVGFNSMWILCIHGYEKTIVPWYKLAFLIGRPVAVVPAIFVARCLVIGVIFEMYRLFRKKFRKKPKVKLEL